MKDNEVGALIQGLAGAYVEPGPGGDPIRNPNVLPTGEESEMRNGELRLELGHMVVVVVE